MEKAELEARLAELEPYFEEYQILQSIALMIEEGCIEIRGDRLYPGTELEHLTLPTYIGGT